jgi:hypothetical protein
MMVDTRHAVGCEALRGGVPCTCWIVPKAVGKPDPGESPLWLAQTRLREQSSRPHLQIMVAVQAADLEQVLDALDEAERVIPWDRGGEA